MKAATDIFDSGRAAAAIGGLARTNSRQGERRYPQDIPNTSKLRVGDKESLSQWFFRAIGEEDPDARIRHTSIEENFAFLGRVVWQDEMLIYCNFQALITFDCTLTDFYLEQQVIRAQAQAQAQNQPQGEPPREVQAQYRAQYYRFDLDVAQPGPLFAEPQPHIHCIPEGSPRFPLVPGQDEYCLISFLEFLYRNHFYDKWLTWVKSVSKQAVTVEELDSVIAAFKSDGIVKKRLGELNPILTRLTTVLKQHKRDQVKRQLPLSEVCAAIAY